MKSQHILYTASFDDLLYVEYKKTHIIIHKNTYLEFTLCATGSVNNTSRLNAIVQMKWFIEVRLLRWMLEFQIAVS